MFQNFLFYKILTTLNEVSAYKAQQFLRSSASIIRIRYKQKTRQLKSHMSLMDHCLTRLFEVTARKKTSTIQFKI